MPSLFRVNRIGLMLIGLMVFGILVLHSIVLFEKMTTWSKFPLSASTIIRNQNTKNASHIDTIHCSDATATLLQEDNDVDDDYGRINITGKSLCFIHVGKTGGASFRTQFAHPRQKKVHVPPSLPTAKFWREFHTENHLRITNAWYDKCDYFVAWVRDPIERAISAYNMIFDPEFTKERRGHIDLQKRLSSWGTLGNLTEHIFEDNVRVGDDTAREVLEDIEHLRYNIAWYFTSDTNGQSLQPPVVSSSMITATTNTSSLSSSNNNFIFGNGKATNKTVISRLSNELFRKKLVFVGSTECYRDDVQRFIQMFGVSNEYLAAHPMPHMRKPTVGGRYESLSNLSPRAIQNFKKYLQTDYTILSSLILDMNLIKCPKLVEKVLC